MNLNDLSKRIAAKLGARAEPEKVLHLASEMLKQELHQGRASDILGLLRMQLKPEALAGKLKGAAAVKILPLPGLIPTARMEAGQDSVVVMVVDPDDPFSKAMAKKLGADGRTVVLAEGMEGLMTTVSNQPVDVVIMDSTLEMADEVRMWIKTDPSRSLTSLIELLPEGGNADTVTGFHVCSDEVLCEPYEVGKLDQLIRSELTRIREERKYFKHMVSFHFPAESVYQQQSATLMEKICASSGLSEEGQMGLVVAFREAIDNAVRHGNMHKENACVQVSYVLDAEKVTVTIEDEGPGFDSSMYIQTRVSGDAVKVARARHKQGRRGGLGIMLMLKSVDKLEYNREGNVAKLTKYIKKAPKAASA